MATGDAPPAKKAKYPTGRRWMLTVFDPEFVSMWTNISEYYRWLTNERTENGQDMINDTNLTTKSKRFLLDLDEKATYAMGQLEVAPTTKREHIQMFIIMKSPCRLTGIKKFLKICDVHAELATKPSAACKKYCSKDDTRHPKHIPYEYGELPDSQGEEEVSDRPSWDVAVRHTRATVCFREDAPFVIVPLRVWEDISTIAREALEDGFVTPPRSPASEGASDVDAEVIDLTV